MQLFEKCMDIALKKCVFYKEKKVPNPLQGSTEGLKYILNAKTKTLHCGTGTGSLLGRVKCKCLAKI